MKKYIVSFILGCVLLVSCEQEKLIFNESQTFVKFGVVDDLSLPIGESASIEVSITVSSVSASERTIPVEVIQDETTLESTSYTLGSIVVPANSYEGMLKIDVQDEGELADIRVLALQVPISAEFSGLNDKLSFSIIQTCPVDITSFVGMYRIKQTTPFLKAPWGDGGTAFSDDVVVEVIAISETRRKFNVIVTPKFCGWNQVDFLFDLVCNKIIVPTQSNACHCGDGNEWFVAAQSPSAYDVNDDSEFTLVFTEGAQGECGYFPAQTSVTFTKQ